MTGADVHRRAVLLSLSVVDRVAPADLDRPTPCAAWTVRDLLTHMTAQHHGFAAAVLDAFADPADQWWLAELNTDRPFPAARARGFHLVDYVAHAWDVAAAIGAPYAPDGEVADAALAVARVVPTGAARERPGSSFGPVVATTDDAATDPLDETLRLLGRDPTWPPPA